ncbi:hypothetical protein [Lysinibacillus sp. ZYM-1]|uniref:hypothetical protein n=1 Tax=Lysinibacillus sp. ZYM-1 TaxID=1681184 RepID=UPI0006CE7629|nr:hypothetical protein [Lysinibacillus sp. ZYM-1]KPN96135.1 hypothetical protein AO843_18785 [Lysinibacillus sp. ZYM-1]
MKLGKKFGIGLAATALSLSLATGAFAYGSDAAETPAPGYGTLKGSSWTTGSTGGAETWVDSNNDNAYLVAGYTIQDRNGKNLASNQTSSARGKRTHSIDYSAPTNAYTIHGTHGVQGGSTYAAKAVYTSVGIR